MEGLIWKPAFMRGIRSFLQGCLVALLAFAAFLGKASAFNWVDIQVEGSKLVLGLALACLYGIISFIQNLLEDNWGGERAQRFKG